MTTDQLGPRPASTTIGMEIRFQLEAQSPTRRRFRVDSLHEQTNLQRPPKAAMAAGLQGAGAHSAEGELIDSVELIATNTLISTWSACSQPAGCVGSTQSKASSIAWALVHAQSR